MSDFDGASVLEFNQVNKKAAKIFKLSGYEEVILPILEEKDLFTKSVGEATDIAERQIFKIEGKDIALRPEGTAQVIRYYLQNSLHKKGDFHKLFYMGAMFRGERPQKGRLRQFHHIGAEAIGSNSAYLDAEMIILSLKILDSIGIKDKTLKINSLGCEDDKNKLAKMLKNDLLKRKRDLCEDCRRRLDKNPLRVLDCKKPQCQIAARGYFNIDMDPKGSLCDCCFDHYKNVLNILNVSGIKHQIDLCMVRGLDYYTNTVFEITAPGLGSQDAIGAGGRYNNLVEFLGGPSKPSIGFALGVERILLSLGELNKKQELNYFIAVDNKSLIKKGFCLLDKLREKGESADFDYCDKSLKGQLRVANKKGAKYVVILSGNGCETNYSLKNMQDSTQKDIKLENFLASFKPKELKKC